MKNGIPKGIEGLILAVGGAATLGAAGVVGAVAVTATGIGKGLTKFRNATYSPLMNRISESLHPLREGCRRALNYDGRLIVVNQDGKDCLVRQHTELGDYQFNERLGWLEGKGTIYSNYPNPMERTMDPIGWVEFFDYHPRK